MMRNTLLVTTALALLLVPAASAQDDGGAYEPSLESMMSEVEDLGQLTVSVESKAITFDWSGLVFGPNMSSWARHTFDDKFGDGDGYLSVEEMENGEDLLRTLVKAEMNSLTSDTRTSGYFIIDTKNPQATEVTALTTEGLVGPVASNESISLDFTAVIGFATDAKDVHAVKLDMGQYYFRSMNESAAAEFADDFTLTIVGAGGWGIDADSVQPSCAAEAYQDGAIVLDAGDVNCFTGPNDGLLLGFTISGGDDGGLPVPGFEAPLIGLALLGGMFLLRRRQ